MQNLYNGLRYSAWAFYIFSLQGNPTTSIQEECTAPRFFYILCSTGCGRVIDVAPDTYAGTEIMNDGKMLALIFGGILGIGLVALLYVAAWESAKKRKIGLTIMSYIVLFFTPFIACIVSYITKKIDKEKKYPTYEQRLPYENTTAMVVAAILFFVFSPFCVIGLIMQDNIVGALVIFIIYLVWGCSLLSERKKLLLAKKEIQTNENDDKTSVVSANNTTRFTTLFEFDSNMQQRIESNKYSEPAHHYRSVLVEWNGEDRFMVSVTDTEKDKSVMNPVIMHKVSYSNIDECLKLISDDNDGEYGLNVFYKDGQVDKCVVSRKSKDIFIHYCKE